jgi:hypothetical protein
MVGNSRKPSFHVRLSLGRQAGVGLVEGCQLLRSPPYFGPKRRTGLTIQPLHSEDMNCHRPGLAAFGVTVWSQVLPWELRLLVDLTRVWGITWQTFITNSAVMVSFSLPTQLRAGCGGKERTMEGWSSDLNDYLVRAPFRVHLSPPERGCLGGFACGGSHKPFLSLLLPSWNQGVWLVLGGAIRHFSLSLPNSRSIPPSVDFASGSYSSQLGLT